MELELHEILPEFGYPDDTPIIIGSALCALEDKNPDIGIESIQKLLEAVDSYIPTPPRDLDKPYLMPGAQLYSIAGRGTVVRGRM